MYCLHVNRSLHFLSHTSSSFNRSLLSLHAPWMYQMTTSVTKIFRVQFTLSKAPSHHNHSLFLCRLFRLPSQFPMTLLCQSPSPGDLLNCPHHSNLYHRLSSRSRKLPSLLLNKQSLNLCLPLPTPPANSWCNSAKNRRRVFPITRNRIGF